MFRGVFTNVAISAAAFFAVSIVGLLIVPVLIGAYGLAGFGLITIARLFLPTAALSVFDFGYSEMATHSVATTRVTGDWIGCARRLCLNFVTAAVVGAVAGIVLFILSAWIPDWCRVPTEHQDELIEVLRVTAILLPLLLASFVAEGVLKGFESFAKQRMVEVVSSLSYAGAALFVVDFGMDYRWVCYALLASLVLRAVLVSSLAVRALSLRRVRPTYWYSSEWCEFWQRVRGLSQNKLLSVAQAHSPSLLVAFLFGPVALGAFDALSRMPRFAKAVLGLLSSTVQPVAARLEQSDDGVSLTRLGRVGMILVSMVAATVLGLAIAFSEPLLRMWIGPEVSTLWGWHALYFVVPTFGALVSFGSSALLGRIGTLKKMNRVILVNVTISVVVALALSTRLGEKAFIASQVVGAMVSVPWHLSIIAREIGLQRETFFYVMRVYVIAVMMSCPVVFLAHLIANPYVLIFGAVAWIIGFLIVCIAFGLPSPMRELLLKSIKKKLHSLL
jgi:O-antigen/teichoic acid export membrane protein